MTWWRRFRPNKATFPAALVATLLCSFGLFLLWFDSGSTEFEMDRYGNSVVSTLAQTTAGDLFDDERINLALTANHLTANPEVAGVTFYNAGNEIVATSGQQKPTYRYTATAILDDTTAGYVSIILDPEAFERQIPWLRGLLTLMIIMLTPVLAMLALQLSARGNRSLPIVSVRKEGVEAQAVYVIALTLNNQYALSREAQIAAIQDALAMAQEVCALYPGIPLALNEKGIALVLAKEGLGGLKALYAAFLIQRLLSEYETDGEFRCFLSESHSVINPAEAAKMDLQQLSNFDDLENTLTLASLAKANTLLVDQLVFDGLDENEKTWARHFNHPILEDLAPATHIFDIPELPEQEAALIKDQATLILGFS